jgi:hypothetical protein
MAAGPYRTGHDELDARIAELVDAAGVSDNEDLVFEMITSAVRMGREDATGATSSS